MPWRVYEWLINTWVDSSTLYSPVSMAVTATSAHCTTVKPDFPLIIIFTSLLSWAMSISSRAYRHHSSAAISLPPAAFPTSKDRSERYITAVEGPPAYYIRVHRETFHSDRIRSNTTRPNGVSLCTLQNYDISIYVLVRHLRKQL
jgi:hypothetical protein